MNLRLELNISVNCFFIFTSDLGIESSDVYIMN